MVTSLVTFPQSLHFRYWSPIASTTLSQFYLILTNVFYKLEDYILPHGFIHGIDLIIHTASFPDFMHS